MYDVSSTRKYKHAIAVRVKRKKAIAIEIVCEFFEQLQKYHTIFEIFLSLYRLTIIMYGSENPYSNGKDKRSRNGYSSYQNTGGYNPPNSSGNYAQKQTAV